MEPRTKNKKRQFVKLGYSHLDTAEIVTQMNLLLANYQVFFHKLRNYHWNVKGADFFDLHKIFMEMYDQVYRSTDEIAEKIRLFGKYPLSTMQEYLSQSRIKEGRNDFSSMEMVKDIMSDMQLLFSEMGKCIHSAQNINDFGTEDMLKSIIRKHEKHYWMLSSWLNQIIV